MIIKNTWTTVTTANLVVRLALGLAVVSLRSGVSPPALAQSSPQAFYVAVTGQASGTGSLAQPWDLRTALAHPSVVQPGDVIWLRGGTYHGTYRSDLRGSPSQPIFVRNYPGERAIIDGYPSNYGTATLFVEVTGADTWYWGLEIMNSDPMRRNAVPGSWPTDIKRGIGVEVHGARTKFINMLVHDNTNGFSLWIDAIDAEVYGNLIFNNGWNSSDRSHGHGVYTQNRTGVRLIKDNLIWNQFGYGIHAYGSDAAYVDNIRSEGNTVFNSGSPDGQYYSANILIGGGRVAINPVARSNATYYTTGLRRGGKNDFGYSVGCSNLQAHDNYFSHVGNYPLVLANCTGTVINNRLFGFVSDEFKAAYPANTYSLNPTGTHVVIRPNAYEAGRGHVTIYNWDKLPSVPVNLAAAGVSVGSLYRVQDAQDYFGPAVATGTYAGGTVSIRMAAGAVVQPIGEGFTVVPSTLPLFGAFVVLADAGVVLPPPTVLAPDPPASAQATPTQLTVGQAFSVAFVPSTSTPPTSSAIAYAVHVNGVRTPVTAQSVGGKIVQPMAAFTSAGLMTIRVSAAYVPCPAAGTCPDVFAGPDVIVSVTSPPSPKPVCSDGLDNDGDKLIDLADPGCTSAADNDETNAPPTPGLPVVSVTVGDADAAEAGMNPGTFLISRTGGNLNSLLVVRFAMSGAAQLAVDYVDTGTAARINPGQSSVEVRVVPFVDQRVDPNESVILTIHPGVVYGIPTYTRGEASATLVIK